MGRPQKNKVRAQRKFAQGAYVPPPSTPPSAPTQVNASHRTMPAPGRVTKNVCNVKDILTRMSLSKAHPHTLDWPIVVLEDCANMLNIEHDKKKVGVKKRASRRLRNNTRKIMSSVSVSDSEEDNDDKPLSQLQNQQVTASTQVKNVGDVEGTPVTTGTSKDNTSETKEPSPEPQKQQKRRSLRHQSKPDSPKSNLPPSVGKSNSENEQHKVARASQRGSKKNRPTDSDTAAPSTKTQPPSKQKIKKTIGKRKRAAQKISLRRKSVISEPKGCTSKILSELTKDLKPKEPLQSNPTTSVLQIENQEPQAQKEGKVTKDLTNLSTVLLSDLIELPKQSHNVNNAVYHMVDLDDENDTTSLDMKSECTGEDLVKSENTEPAVLIDTTSSDWFDIPSVTDRSNNQVNALDNDDDSEEMERLVYEHTDSDQDYEVEHLQEDYTIEWMAAGLEGFLPKAQPKPKLIQPTPPNIQPNISELTEPMLVDNDQPIIIDNVHSIPSTSRSVDTTSMDIDDETSTTESRLRVVCLTPHPEESVFDKFHPYSSWEDKNTWQPLPLMLDKSKSGPESGDTLVYRPTLEEFKDPIAYIKTIEEQASKYGICKIIPPDGFLVPYHLDDNCVFGTTNQHLGRLYHRWGPNTREMATIQTYLASLTPRDKERFTKAPLFGGVEVDLVKLYHLVLKQGGIAGNLAQNEKWARIASQMNFVSPRGKPDSKKLEKLYCKHVLPYESLTSAEREAARDKADKIWKIRLQNAILRTSRPLHYQQATLKETNLPEYEEAFPDADLSDLYNICKPIYDKIEECTGKGRAMNLATFRRISAQIEGMRFPNGLPSTIEEIESQYWEILNLGNEHVCVLSAFIDTSVNNLGHESDPKKPGGSHPWNLKRIGENPLNILHSLGKALAVTVPTLCLNQLFSTNSWHMDPHKLSWLDFMLEGSTKIWYAVPGSGAPAFRKAVQMLTEAAVQNKGIWLASDTTMIPPGHLAACGVPIRRVEQKPNEYIVVFPGAYACSISTGHSVSESVYFASASWLDHVEKVFEDLHEDCEPAMFSSVLLLMKMARKKLSFDVLSRVCNILKTVFKDEFVVRNDARKLSCKVTTDKRGREDGNLMPVSWPNQEECCLCRIPLVLSKMSKYDEPRKQMCLPHGMRYMHMVNQRPREERPEQPPVVTLHYTDQELTELMGTLELCLMGVDIPEDR